MENISQIDKAKILFKKIQSIKYKAHEQNVRMLVIAKELYYIKKNKLYRYWDINEKPNWKTFIANSEIALSHNVCDKWIRVYKEYILKKKLEMETISDITLKKLMMLLSLGEKLDLDWIETARQLSQSDLQKEIELCLGTRIDEMKCEHKWQKLWRCKKCRIITKIKPNDEVKNNKVGVGQSE